jgi:hypothetical protein
MAASGRRCETAQRTPTAAIVASRAYLGHAPVAPKATGAITAAALDNATQIVSARLLQQGSRPGRPDA